MNYHWFIYSYITLECRSATWASRPIPRFGYSSRFWAQRWVLTSTFRRKCFLWALVRIWRRAWKSSGWLSLISASSKSPPRRQWKRVNRFFPSQRGQLLRGRHFKGRDVLLWNHEVKPSNSANYPISLLSLYLSIYLSRCRIWGMLAEIMSGIIFTVSLLSAWIMCTCILAIMTVRECNCSNWPFDKIVFSSTT